MNDIASELAKKTYRELGLDQKTGKPLKNSNPPVTSHKFPYNSQVSKTLRQAKSTQGYKASASWQTASLLRDLSLLLSHSLPSNEFKRKSQFENANRSTVANIEEGWARPTTREFLDFLGFSQASHAEVRGDIERLQTDGLLPSKPGSSLKSLGIPTPSRNFPYPPVSARRKPMGVDEKLREFTGKEIKAQDLTYESLIELANKTDYLLRRQVEGLQQKLARDEEAKKIRAARTWERKYVT